MSNEKSKEMDSADVTPESLMERFKGPGLVKMIIVTVVFHAVLVFGTSVTYMKKSIFGDEVAAMTKEKRIEKAVGEATSSLRKIAVENGLNPQDISDNFSSSAARAAKAAAATDKGLRPLQTLRQLKPRCQNLTRMEKRRTPTGRNLKSKKT